MTVRYQAIIEYVIIGSAALTSFSVAALAYRGFFTAHHQLRQEVFL
jgi:ABC-type iron transport system FetAB permease component